MVVERSGEVVSERLARLTADIDAGVRGAVDAFWNEAKACGTPLVEMVEGKDGVCLVTFLWRESPDEPIDHVAVAEWFSGREMAPRLMERLGETDIWYRTVEMDSRLRFTYGYWINDSMEPLRDGPELPERVKRIRFDPLNPKRAFQSWMTKVETEFNRDSSVVELPDARPFRWRVDRGAPKGEVVKTTFSSERLGGERDVWVYTSPGIERADEDAALLVQFDGDACAGMMALPAVLDNLRAEGLIRPVVGVFVGHGPYRGMDLTCNPEFTDVVADELIPWARSRYRIGEGPESVIVAGQSLGGLAAAWIGLTRPDAVGSVISQSGSFWFLHDLEMAFGATPPVGTAPGFGWLPAEVATWDRVPTRFWLEVGTLEMTNEGLMPSMVYVSRHMRDVLLAKGYDVTYREYPGGHEWWYWGELLADGILRFAGSAGRGNNRSGADVSSAG